MAFRKHKKNVIILRYLIVIVLFTTLISTSKIYGEQSQTIDSLKKVIETAKGDTTKAKALLRLSEQLYFSNLDTAIQLSRQALQIYIKKNIEKGIANAYNHLGEFHRMKSDNPTALEYHKKGIIIRKKLKDKPGLARSYNNIGLIYMYQSDYPQALEYYFQSLKIEEQLGNKLGMARTSNNIGMIYNNQSDYPLALDYYFESLKIFEEMSNKRGMASSYGNIGAIYYNQPDYPLALNYYFKYLKMEEELGNKRGIASSSTLIGRLFTSIYEQADSAEYSEVGGWAVDNPDRLLDTAFYYQQRAYTLNRELNTQFIMVNTLLGIGSIYSLKNDYVQATKYYKQAVQLADSIGALSEASNAHSGLAECYEKLGNYQNALEHYKQYAILKDSTFNEEKSKDLGKLEAKHEFEIAKSEQKRQEEQQTRISEEQTERRNLLQYSGILIFIVVFFITLLFIVNLNIPVRFAEGGIFFTFLLVFEFILVLTDPYIEQYTGGEPAYKLIINAGLAGLIFPLHSIAEAKLKQRLFKTKKEIIEKGRKTD